MTKHTAWKLWNGYGPLPNGKWAAARIGPNDYDASIVGAEGHDIIGQREVLEHIVRCVNSHEKLVKALEAMLADHDCPGSFVTETGCEVCTKALAALKDQHDPPLPHRRPPLPPLPRQGHREAPLCMVFGIPPRLGLAPSRPAAMQSVRENGKGTPMEKENRMKRQWYYHGTSNKRWEGIQMHSAFAILPVYLTTDKRRAEHYAKARSASDGDSQYAIIGLCLPRDKVLVDNYSPQEPDQYKLFRQLHRATFYSKYLTCEVTPMPMDETELRRLKAFCIGMGYDMESRRFAPGFEHLASVPA